MKSLEREVAKMREGTKREEREVRRDRWAGRSRSGFAIFVFRAFAHLRDFVIQNPSRYSITVRYRSSISLAACCQV